MFFDEPVVAFTNIARQLSRVAALRCACWRTLAENQWHFVDRDREVPSAAAFPRAREKPDRPVRARRRRAHYGHPGSGGIRRRPPRAARPDRRRASGRRHRRRAVHVDGHHRRGAAGARPRSPNTWRSSGSTTRRYDSRSRSRPSPRPARSGIPAIRWQGKWHQEPEFLPSDGRESGTRSRKPCHLMAGF